MAIKSISRANAYFYVQAKPGSADKSLLTHENAVFLETVREKLRGQIVVGVLDKSKTRAVNKAIKDVTELLNKNVPIDPPPVIERVEVSKPPSISAPAQTSQQAASVNDAEEKRDLAIKLAAALAAQGKTNVTSEQLEQLIAVYSLIEKKQKESSNEPRRQNLSDLLVNSLKEPAASASRQSGGFNDDRNFSNTFDNSRRPQQQQMHQNPFSGSMNTNQSNQMSGRSFQSGGGKNNMGSNSNQNLSSTRSSFMGSSFGLSNFDTSLSLSNLPPLSFSRQQDSNNSNRQQSNNDDNNQNTPAYMTNMARGGNKSGNRQDMVSYPSVWQRGSGVGSNIGGGGGGGGGGSSANSNIGSRNQGAGQPMPMGWQQNENRRGNNKNNRNNMGQNRGRR